MVMLLHLAPLFLKGSYNLKNLSKLDWIVYAPIFGMIFEDGKRKSVQRFLLRVGFIKQNEVL